MKHMRKPKLNPKASLKDSMHVKISMWKIKNKEGYKQFTIHNIHR